MDETTVVGIKESEEFVAMVGLVGNKAMLIGSDGKVNFDDLKHLLDMGKQMNVFIEGVTGLDKMLAEIKDLDGEESKKLLMLLIEKMFAKEKNA